MSTSIAGLAGLCGAIVVGFATMDAAAQAWVPIPAPNAAGQLLDAGNVAITNGKLGVGTLNPQHQVHLIASEPLCFFSSNGYSPTGPTDNNRGYALWAESSGQGARGVLGWAKAT